MITKVVIRDNEKTPISYLPKLKNFENGKIYEFKEGVNVIVGENGCGKSTILKIIKYLSNQDYNSLSKIKFDYIEVSNADISAISIRYLPSFDLSFSEIILILSVLRVSKL